MNTHIHHHSTDDFLHNLAGGVRLLVAVALRHRLRAAVRIVGLVYRPHLGHFGARHRGTDGASCLGLLTGQWGQSQDIVILVAALQQRTEFLEETAIHLLDSV